MTQFIEQNNILSKFQNGFRQNRSTIQTIFDFTSDLYQINNVNKDALAIYVDYQKAFDTVNHTRLLKKFDELKFGRKLCTWLRSYLTDRTQKTCGNNVTSSSRIVPYGVPQGSVLGPLRFIIYLNDLTNCVKNCKYLLYAYDIVIYKDLDQDINPNNCQRVQQDVSNITEWCQINELTINCKKTKAQFFSRNRIFRL